MTTKALKKGDRVRIRRYERGDEWSAGTVAAASDPARKPQSVLVILDNDTLVRVAGGFIGGALPVSVDYDAEKIVGLDRQEYEMEVR